MTYTSSAKDIMYTFAGTLSYYLECDGNVVFCGKAQGLNGSINITRRIRDYLETNMPDFREFDGVIVPHPKQLRTFNLRTASGLLLETYTVMLESTGEWDIFGPLTEPINGHTDSRQKIFWSTVESAENSYESNTEGAEYSGETESGETEYYFNYTSPTSQVFSAATTSTTISWETNYGDIAWSVYDVNGYGMVSSGISSSDSLTITFPGNTGDTNILYEFRAYSVLDGSYLGSVFWNVSSPQDSTSGSTTGTTYSFTPTYTTAYTDGSDVIWYYQTDCPDPINLFIYNVSTTEGFSISVDEKGNGYTRIKINSLPTETGKTASCSIRIRGYESQGDIGCITIINTAASEAIPVKYFTIEPLSSVTKVLACAVLKESGSTASLHYRINEGSWEEQVFSGGRKYAAKNQYESTVTLSNGEVIEKIELYAVRNGSTIAYYIEPYSDDYHYLFVEGDYGTYTVETMAVPYKASGDYASLVYGEGITGMTRYSAIVPDSRAAFASYGWGNGGYWNSQCLTLYDAEDMVFPDVIVNELAYYRMFYSCYNLRTPPKELSSTRLGQQAYAGMFASCNSLETMPDIKFDGEAGIGVFYGMFSGCRNLKINVSLKLKKVVSITLANMFERSGIIGAELMIDTIDTWEGNAGNSALNLMFADCANLRHFSLSPYTAEKVVVKGMTTNATTIFPRCTALETASLSPLYFEATQAVYAQSLSSIFSRCTSLSSVDIHFENLFSMSYAFTGCINLSNINLYGTSLQTGSPQFNGLTANFLDDASPTGTITINRDCPITPGSIPSGWTIVYSD